MDGDAPRAPATRSGRQIERAYSAVDVNNAIVDHSVKIVNRQQGARNRRIGILPVYREATKR
ncbi:MAG: hypothetical protein JWN70_5159 [Planctomycetaceae bacterium]|nr:hypothetical protein [Planctomycetaceae bacterium]